jgi:hypothetical protein
MTRREQASWGRLKRGKGSAAAAEPGSLVREAASERPEKQKARTERVCVREATKTMTYFGTLCLSCPRRPSPKDQGEPWPARFAVPEKSKTPPFSVLFLGAYGDSGRATSSFRASREGEDGREEAFSTGATRLGFPPRASVPLQISLRWYADCRPDQNGMSSRPANAVRSIGLLCRRATLVSTRHWTNVTLPCLPK